VAVWARSHRRHFVWTISTIRKPKPHPLRCS